MIGLNYPSPMLLSGGLLTVALYLLTYRLRDQGVGEREVDEIVDRHRPVFEEMSDAEVASRYLTELSVREMTGPH